MHDPAATNIDVNTAERETLIDVPGIGPNIADQIIARRPFAELEELRQVHGIGPDLYQRIEPYLTISDFPVPEISGAEEQAKQEEQISWPSIGSEDEQSEGPGAMTAAEAPAMSETVFVTEEPAFTETTEAAETAETAVFEEQPAEPETSRKEPEGEEEPPAAPIPKVPEIPSAMVYDLPEEEMETEEEEEEEPAPEAILAEEPHGPLEPVTSEEPALESETKFDEPDRLDAADKPLPARPAAAEPAAGVMLETEPRRQEGISRSGAFWMAFFASLVSFVLAVALSLGVLAAINGGLTYVGPAQFASLRRQVDGLNAQASILVQDIDGLRSRLDNLEPLSGRVTTIEQANEELSANLEGAVADVEQLNQQAAEIDQAVTELVGEVETLQSRTGRFQTFLDGLRELLGSLNQP